MLTCLLESSQRCQLTLCQRGGEWSPVFKSQFLSEGDPSNYLTYYKRGTVYLALGKAKFALLDLDKVLELKADFTPARLQRGNILLKQAHFDEAESDFRNVVRYPLRVYIMFLHYVCTVYRRTTHAFCSYSS